MRKHNSLSFIIPLFNASKFITKCVDSCLAQATDSLLIEVVIVDDGSTDDGVDVVKEKYGRLSNVRVITQPNAGVSAARNHGIAEATGEYIMFVDADDYLSQKALEPLIKHMTDADIEVLAHGAIVEPSTTPKSNASVNDCVLGNCMGGVSYLKQNLGPYYKDSVSGAWGFIIKRDIISHHSDCRFVEGLPFGEDSLFFIRLLLHNPITAFTQQRFYHYVQHPQSVMHRPHSIKTLIEATLTRCVENRNLELMATDREVANIIIGRSIAIAFSRLFKRMLRNKAEANFAPQAIAAFKVNGMWPLTSLPATHSPYVGKKALLYRFIMYPPVYRTLAWCRAHF